MGNPLKALTESIIGAAIEVHRRLGPGLLESAYRHCFAHELGLRKMLLNTRNRCRFATRVRSLIVVIAWISWSRASWWSN